MFFLLGLVEFGHGQVIVLDNNSLDLDLVSITEFEMLDSIAKHNTFAVKTEIEHENAQN